MTGEVERTYHVATPKQPIHFRLQGPRWIRIDRLHNQRTFVDYRMVASGWQDLELACVEGQQQTLYRVFSLTPEPAKIKVPLEQSAPEVTPLNSHVHKQELEFTFKHGSVLDDKFPLGGQEDGTWSFRGAFVRLRVFDDDDAAQARQYMEVSATHRYFSPEWRSYFETVGLTRAHEFGGPTLGAREIFYHDLFGLPFNLEIEARAYMQWPDGQRFEPTGKTEWSLHLQSIFTYRHEINAKTNQFFAFKIFGRCLSMKTNKNTRPLNWTRTFLPLTKQTTVLVGGFQILLRIGPGWTQNGDSRWVLLLTRIL